MLGIEEAGMKDCARLCELLRILFEQEHEFSPDTKKQSKGLEMILSNPSVGRILVLKKEGYIIGMVSLLFTVSTALGEKVAWLEDMVIDPLFQGQGYGKMLLREVLQRAKLLTCKRVSLKTDAHNERAQKMYKALGFEDSTMKVMFCFTS